MRQRRSDDAIDRRLVRNLAEPELLEHARSRNLPGGVTLARVGPERVEVCGQYARGRPGRTHADQHGVRGALELQKVDVVRKRARHDGNLDDLGAGCAHAAYALNQISGYTCEIVA